MGYVCTARVHGTEGELALDKDGNLRLQTRAAHAAGQAPTVIQPEPPERETWAAFAHALETREPTWTHSGDNLHSLAMLFAAIESAESGRIVQPVSDFAALLTQ